MGLLLQEFLISRMRFTSEYGKYGKLLSMFPKTGNGELQIGQGRTRALNYGYG